MFRNIFTAEAQKKNKIKLCGLCGKKNIKE